MHFLLILTLSLACQSPGGEPPVPSASERALSPASVRTVTQAIDKFDQSRESQREYVRFDLELNQNYLENGRKTSDTKKVYEDTWLFGLPYKNLVALNGKPLSEQAKREEKARFDKAVEERRALDLAERARLTGGKVVSGDLKIRSILGPGYHLEALGVERCGEVPCRVYVATPLASNPNAPPLTYRLWITDADPFIFRLIAVRPAIVQKKPKEESTLVEWQLLNGLPVEMHSRFVGFTKIEDRLIEIHTENFYSGYRRFSSSIRILPGQLEDSEALPAALAHP